MEKEKTCEDCKHFYDEIEECEYRGQLLSLKKCKWFEEEK